MLHFDVFFIGSWEEQISGESTAAHFDLSKEHMVRIPTAAFWTQPSIVSTLSNNVKISLGQTQFSERIMSFCSKSKTRISPSRLCTSPESLVTWCNKNQLEFNISRTSELGADCNPSNMDVAAEKLWILNLNPHNIRLTQEQRGSLHSAHVKVGTQDRSHRVDNTKREGQGSVSTKHYDVIVEPISIWNVITWSHHHLF